MALFCLEPKVQPVLPLSLVKGYIKIDHDDDDALLNELSVGAQSLIENYAGASLVQRAWKYIFPVPRFVAYHLLRKRSELNDQLVLELPCNPVQSITRIQIQKDQKMTPCSSYQMVKAETSTEIFIPRKEIERHTKVHVDFEAGYKTPEEIPVFLRHAVLFTVAHFYQQRDQAKGPSSQARLPTEVCTMLYGITVRNRLS